MPITQNAQRHSVPPGKRRGIVKACYTQRTTYHLVPAGKRDGLKLVLSPDIISSDWLRSKHRLTCR